MGLHPLHRALLAVSLGAIASLVALSLLPAGAHAQPEDTWLSGTVTNTTLELWGDLLIPVGETLELVNCTVLFHCEPGTSLGIKGGDGSSLIIRDLDGSPTTLYDMTTISSVGDPWGIDCIDGGVLEVRCSRLVGLGDGIAHWSDGVRLLTSYIQCVGEETRFDTDMVLEVDGCTFNLTNGGFTGSGSYASARFSLIESAMGHSFLMGGSVETRVVACTFEGYGGRGLRVSGDRALVEYCTFDHLALGLELSSGRSEVRVCEFLDCTKGISGGGLSTVIEDCAFNSSAMDEFGISLNARAVIIRGCAFEDVLQAVILDGGSYNISDCSFVGCAQGIFAQGSGTLRLEGSSMSGFICGLMCKRYDEDVPFALAEVSGCSFESGDHAIYINKSIDDVRLTDTSFMGCTVGVFIDALPKRTVDILHCSFADISYCALQSLFTVASNRMLRFENCTFTNVSIGLNQTRDGYIKITDSGQEIVLNTNIVRCAFTGPGVAIREELGILTVEDCTFDGSNPGGKHGEGLDLWLSERVPSEVHIGRSHFANCSMCIHFNARGSRGTSIIEVVDTTLEDCGYGVMGSSNGTVSIDRVDFRRCELALNVTNTTTVLLLNTTVRDCGDGLELYWCHLAFLRDVVGSNVTGWLVEMSDLVTAVWKMTRPGNISNVRIKFFGALDLWADTELYEVDLLVDGTDTDWSDVIVHEGVSLSIVRSRLHCTAFGSYGLFTQARSTLEVRESSVSGMRRSYTRPILAGPRVDGGTAIYTDSTFTDCLRCLTVVNGTATVLRCDLEGADSAIHAISSNLTVIDSDLGGGITGLATTWGNLSIQWSTIEGWLGAIVTEGTRVQVSNSTMRPPEGSSSATRADVVGLRMAGGEARLEHVRILGWVVVASLSGGTVELWECELEPGSTGEVLMDCGCRLYNTSWDGRWLVSMGTSSVEVYFSHAIAARYRWSMEPVTGADVVIVPSLEGNDPRHVPLGPFGRCVGVWLMQRRIIERETAWFAPYNLTIELPGLLGEATTRCDAPVDVTILVRDISPPEVHISSPPDGSLHATGTVHVRGTVTELGSGLSALMYCVDSGDWVPVPFGGEVFDIPVSLSDGAHAVSIRALDADGNQGLNYTGVVVDTASPGVGFLSPAGGTSVNATTVLLRGYASAKGGTELARVTLDGMPVPLNGTGEFLYEAALPEEGPHTFVLLALDAAGNRATATLLLVRDTLPPVLKLDGCPNETNEPELVLTGKCTGGNVFVNGREAFQTFDGTFRAILRLSEGTNRIEAIATDEAGNAARAAIDVLLDTVAEGTIVEPIEGAVIRGDAVRLVLVTEHGASAMVVGRTEWMAANGTGDLVIVLDDLPEGALRLSVAFRDRVGNQDVRSVNVTLSGSAPETATTDWGVWAVIIALVVTALVVIVGVKRARRRDRQG